MSIEDQILEHKDFWLTMYGAEKWKEISGDIKQKDPVKLLDLLDKKLEEIAKKEFTKISIFSNVSDITPKPFYLEKWLFQTLKPFDDVSEKVKRFRKTFDKSIKESLPCCTVSGSFSGIRNLENIKSKNQLICLDIDRFTKSKKRKCNTCVDMQLVKEMFMQHPSTLYTGFSCSGDGVYAIMRIYEAEKLAEYFNYFQQKLARIGLNIDEICKDSTRLRFISVDEEGYFNPNAKFLKLPKAEDKLKVSQNPQSQNRSNTDRVEALCNVIEKNTIDITSAYDDWVKIAAALFSEFGDFGSTYFHRISRYHPEYSEKSCDAKFNQSRKMSKVNISSLFYVASIYGVRY
jgi:hypothetical protein